MRAAVALLLVLTTVLAGCAERAPLCRGGTPDEGEESVCFTTADRWIVRGGVRGDAGPVVVLVHGADETRRDLDNLSRTLAASGFRVLSFDLRGHGETSHGGSRPDPRGFTTQDWLKVLGDLDAAANFTQSRWGERPSAVVGSDVGANLALRWARQTQGVEAVALLSPGMNLRGVTLDEGALSYRGDVLAVAAARDPPAAETARRLESRMPNADVAVVEVAGSAHGAALLEDPAALGAVVSFLGEATR